MILECLLLAAAVVLLVALGTLFETGVLRGEFYRVLLKCLLIFIITSTSTLAGINLYLLWSAK